MSNTVEQNLQIRIGRWKKDLLGMTKANRQLWYKPMKVGTLVLDEKVLDERRNPLEFAIQIIEGDKAEFSVVASQEYVIENYAGKYQKDASSSASVPGSVQVSFESAEDKSIDVSDEKIIDEMQILAERERERIAQRTKRLTNIRKKIKEESDERGINIGYLVVGFLTWFERDDASQPAKSPIIMIPITIDQEVKSDPFSIALNLEEEISINPSLLKMLQTDFGVECDMPADLNFDDTLDAFRKIAEKFPNWIVEEECCIDTFNFQNLSILADFEKNAELIMSSPFGKVLGGADIEAAGITYSHEDVKLKEVKSRENVLLLESDSSQLEAVYRARQGESFVIQGPPGTGKSQTITNIIAEQLYLGKKVLFVAEKQAALDVVYSKLEKKGLSNFCLMMHSSKQKKTDVREQLQESLSVAGIRNSLNREAEEVYEKLDNKRVRLNDYDSDLHQEISCGLTPFDIFGELASLNRYKDVFFDFPDTHDWGEDYLSKVRPMFEAVEEYGRSFVGDTRCFSDSYWTKYTGSFSTGTKREVKEIFDSIDVEAIAEVKDRFLNEKRGKRNHKKILSVLSDFFKIIDSIPFEGADTLEIKALNNLLQDYDTEVAEECKQIKQIGSNTNDMQESSRVKEAEIESEAERLKQIIADSFMPEIFGISGIQGIHKAMMNKYSSLLSRLSSDYKQLISSIKPLEIRKMKHKELVQELGNVVKLELLFESRDLAAKQLERKVAENKEQITECEKKIEAVNRRAKGKLSDLKNAVEVMVENIADLVEGIDFDQLVSFQANYQAREKLKKEYGLDDFCSRIEDPKTAYQASEIESIFRKRYFTILIEKGGFGEKYHTYTRDEHDRDVSLFRKYDEDTLKCSAVKIITKLKDNLPNLSGHEKTNSSSEASILKRELKKKRRLMPTRKLIQNLPILIPQIKPCMMMSPLTVSSYFGTNPDWQFDVVIFDEASQVRPEYAVLSIARGRQVIVAGDSRQLPPTRFFDAGADEDFGYDESEDGGLDDLESILDEMSTCLPDVYLNWHYRSKDDSLISFSNKHFYGDRLNTFPSANQSEEVGLGYIYCENGVWGSRDGNRAEAEKVAQLVFEHIDTQPDRSLGIVAFGKSQEIAISNAVEAMRLERPECENFFSEQYDEEFFVKNLENVQGDERDRIILSCGYGKGPDGKFAMRFGPLSMAGGERRLNVAISRAKYQMTVVSSFRASEIRNVEDNANRKLLQDYIDFAANGRIAALGTTAEQESNYAPEFDSKFEQDVYSFLRNNGFMVRSQVGSSGYKIDMAVLHPEIANRYIIAIECDGKAYHSSKTARDRDLLRQEVLERNGWKFYRIWSTNWFYDNTNEKNRLLAAVNDAIEIYASLGGGQSKSNTDDAGEDNACPWERFAEDDEGHANNDLANYYSIERKKLIGRFGHTEPYRRGRNPKNDGWDSLKTIRSNAFLSSILLETVKQRAGYSPEEVFREINEGLFQKKRFTEQSRVIYEAAFQKLLDSGQVEIVQNSIRIL